MIARLLLVVLFVSTISPHTARAQSALTPPAPFATVQGLNTVPDHGDTVVSWLDYRNGSYRIMVIDVQSQTEQEITSAFFAEPEVVTFGDRVAWVGYTPLGVPDVYLHDRSEASTEQVTTDAAFQNHPDLGSRYLIWQDYADSPGDGSGADIRAREHDGGAVVRITDDDFYQDLPRTHGNRVVWQDFRHAGGALETADIYVYDGGSGTELRLTSGAAYRANPAIWSDLVVWEDYRGGDNADIYLYDLSTGAELQVTDDPGQQSHPAVYGDWVLWLDYRNSAVQGDLYGYNLATAEEYPLVVDPAHQDRPAVHDNHVVWQDYRNGAFDVWAAELLDPGATGVERPADALRRSGSAAPNPSKGSVTLHFGESPGGSHADVDRVDVIDMLGRVVWSVQPAQESGSVRWTGTDNTGRAVSPGIYVARILRADRSEWIPIVRK